MLFLCLLHLKQRLTFWWAMFFAASTVSKYPESNLRPAHTADDRYIKILTTDAESLNSDFESEERVQSVKSMPDLITTHCTIPLVLNSCFCRKAVMFWHLSVMTCIKSFQVTSTQHDLKTTRGVNFVADPLLIKPPSTTDVLKGFVRFQRELNKPPIHYCNSARDQDRGKTKPEPWCLEAADDRI